MAQPSQSQYVEQPRFCESCPLCITGKSHPARLPVPSGLHVRASHENLSRLFRSARAAQCVTTKRDPDRSRGLPVSAGYLARTHDPHHQRKGCEDWSGQHPAPSQYYQTKKIPTRRLRLRAASCALPTSKPRPRISHQSTSVPCRVNPLYAFSRAREGIAALTLVWPFPAREAPERSEYRQGRHILHLWRCPKCDYCFEGFGEVDRSPARWPGASVRMDRDQRARNDRVRVLMKKRPRPPSLGRTGTGQGRPSDPRR